MNKEKILNIYKQFLKQPINSKAQARTFRIDEGKVNIGGVNYFPYLEPYLSRKMFFQEKHYMTTSEDVYKPQYLPKKEWYGLSYSQRVDGHEQRKAVLSEFEGCRIGLHFPQISDAMYELKEKDNEKKRKIDIKYLRDYGLFAVGVSIETKPNSGHFYELVSSVPHWYQLYTWYDETYYLLEIKKAV